MTKSNKLRILCFAAMAGVLAVLGAVCFVFAMSGEFDFTVGLFNENSVFAPALYCILLAAPILGIVLWVLFRRYTAIDRPLPISVPFMVMSAVCAVAIIAEAGLSFLSSVSVQKTTYAAIQYLGWIFAVLAAVSLIFNMLSDGKVSRTSGSLLAFFPPLYCAARVLIMYFDKTVAVNSPVKIIFQLAMISFMLMFTAEAGISLGRGNIIGRYLFSLCCSVALGGAVMVGSAAVLLTSNETFPYPAPTIIVGLSLFLYSAVRLVSCTGVQLEPSLKNSEKEAEPEKQNKSAESENV